MSSALEHRAASEASVPAFLYRQLFVYPTRIPPSVNLAGQTAIVTGANVGLGFECLRKLLDLGISHAILAVRNQAKGDAAAVELRRQFPKAHVDVMLVDMASYGSVRAFAEECKKLNRLDIAILNAGMQATRFVRNPETGHESTLQTNYLSTMLLATLLVPIMTTKRQQDTPGRLSIVGSGRSLMAKLDPTAPIFAQFDDEDRFNAFGAYDSSKLLLTTAMIKLAELVDPDDVIINVVNPGLCAGTSFGKDDKAGWVTKYVGPLVARLLGRSAKTGALAYIDAAVVKGKESHGSYCADWAIKPYPPVLYSEKGEVLKKRLWEETSEELHLEQILSGLKN